ncbi:MAG: AAA family ATPase [Limosilactobacillus pontis]|uniref:ATP-binding protein n=1 Tax=Limosilactobacillus pontis TaxID=35787 RepID=A0A2J6NPU6_9LACO|nr:ATP-binding protein [Limosilactobacillus pontis]PMB83334.1 ATP-binding protein [Limosilactobacillus pontis]
MLIDFTIKNFRSFKDEADLSAETGARLTKYKQTNTFSSLKVPVLKSLLIFGPNGAGKSQLFNALFLMRQMVLNGGAQTITQQLPYNPFKFDHESSQQPTTFTVKFERGKTVYEYSFSYDSEAITAEKLVVFNTRKARVYFNIVNNEVVEIDPQLENPGKRLRRNALFLYVAQQENDLVAAEVYKWFAQDLVFIKPDEGVPAQFLTLMDNAELKREMVSFLNFADFNISDITIRKVPLNIPPELVKMMGQLGSPKAPQSTLQLYTIHKSYDEYGNVIGSEELPLYDESVGTQKLFVIVLAMIFSQIHHNGKTILIDEFDDSLHYELSSALVKIFNSVENNNQYIITTHNFNLLDAGIRVDQIYFVEKNFMGQSDLKSAFDFTDSRGNARRDAHFAKKYIQGQYGAIPVIDTDSLLGVLAEVKKAIGATENDQETQEKRSY